VIYDIGIMSNATRILGTSTTKAIARGSIPVQQKTIKLSYRIRGRVARNQTKRKQKAQVFRPSTILCRLMKVSLINSSGIL
jgi:fibronectin type 3 domain-containing protein